MLGTRALKVGVATWLGIMAGLLADQTLEPALRTNDSALAPLFGPLFGVGPGSGMALLIAISAVATMIVGLGAYAFRAVRNAEDLLPDHVNR